MNQQRGDFHLIIMNQRMTMKVKLGGGNAHYNIKLSRVE